jgi:hypothetical protein
MKISVRQLRRLIREAISQINYPPGRYPPGRPKYMTGEPLDLEKLDQLCYDGFPDGIEKDSVQGALALPAKASKVLF